MWLTWCSNVFQTKMKEAGCSFSFTSVFDRYSCLSYWNEFFSHVFQALDWIFLVLHLDGDIWSWIPKVIWPRMDWYWGFFWENGFLRWLHICLDWTLQILLNSYSFLTTSFFFRCLVWGVILCVLWNFLYFLAIELFWNQLINFRIAMQLYFFSFCVFQAIF